MTTDNNDTPNVEVKEETVTVVELPTQLSETDKLALMLAKTNRQLVLEQAKTALANNEKAEIEFKYVVLQLYKKYNLSEKDSISENGQILRG